MNCSIFAYQSLLNSTTCQRIQELHVLNSLKVYQIKWGGGILRAKMFDFFLLLFFRIQFLVILTINSFLNKSV